MSTIEWSDLARWYDEKQGDSGDFWHRELLDPALFALLGDVAGQQVLDLACGNGHNSRRLARMGAVVTGIDLSAALIERNRARDSELGITYHVADAAQLSMLADDTFDIVVCQMALMDMPDAAAALREASRVLRAKGRFVAMILHPCFDVPEASGWIMERMGPETTIWRKVGRYRTPFAGRIHWRVEDELVYTLSYHRPLSWYVKALRDAGCVVTALEEPAPSAEFVAQRIDGAWMTEIPLNCLIEARKISLD